MIEKYIGLIMFSCSALSFAEGEVHPKMIYGEENYRLEIGRRHKDLVTVFYYFDGRQTFALFKDSKKKVNNMLLLVCPDWSVTKFTYKEGGVDARLERTPFSFKVGQVEPKTKKLTGEVDYTIKMGFWFTVKKGEEIDLSMTLNREWDFWNLVAKRTATGIWQGNMTKKKEEK